MQENRKESTKRVIIYTVMVVAVVAVTLSLSSAFFQSSIGTEAEEKIVLRAGNLALTFRDNDETVENTERAWTLGDSVEKEFLIENTGTATAYAKINWENLINTYMAESLTYTLEEKTDEVGSTYKKVETPFKNVPRSETASTLLLAEHLAIPVGHTYIYRLRITFENLPDVDQTPDVNAKFITKFVLKESTKKKTTEDKLADLNIKISETNPTSFYVSANTDETENGLFSMEDDYGMSYYYRGTAPNNYFRFGRNAAGEDMWWRIIRFNGNGTIRIIYDGTGLAGSNTYSPNYALQERWYKDGDYSFDVKYIGWMYGGQLGEVSTSKEEAQKNETDSWIKTKVDEWYKTNIVDTGYGSFVGDAIFCNDRSTPGKVATGLNNDTGLGYGNKTTGYGAYARLGIGSTTSPNYKNPKPQFTCPQENDRFTVEETSGGNGALTYPVGLITMDEAITGGVGYVSDTLKHYLKKVGAYWTMSPYYSFTMFSLLSGEYEYYSIDESHRVAPVINLKAEYLSQFRGKGTIDDPYYLD